MTCLHRTRVAGSASTASDTRNVCAELMVAIMTLPWPISTEYPEDCRYNTLLQISIGQVHSIMLPAMLR